MQRRTGRSYQLFPLLLLFLFLFAACGDLEGSGNAPDPEENISDDSASPAGDFGVSLMFDGPYLNDVGEAITSPDDERVVEVEPGGKFYVQVDYEDPSGITDIEVNLVNSNPEGLAGALDPTQGFFTLGQPTNISEPSGCDLSSNPTSVTCIYEVQVADDAVSIAELEGSAGEFAYVFRTKVTDAAGNISDEAERGYVTVAGERDGGEGEPEPQPETCVNPVEIPDEVLEQVVRNELGKQEGALTCEDLASLTELNSNPKRDDPGIASFEGLQFATNLTTILSYEGELSDLSPLSNLTKLESLLLANNEISDVSPLANLTNLKLLILSNSPSSENLNSVTDLTPLENLAKLETLTIRLNGLSSLEGLPKANLIELDAPLNNIEDLSPLSEAEQLEDLNLLGNEISDLSPLANLSSLRSITLSENEISDITPLQNLPNLFTVDLNDNQIGDITPLVNNEGVNTNDRVNLLNNSLETCPGTEGRADIDALIARGVDVLFDVPENCDGEGGNGGDGFIDVTTTSGAASLEDECTLRAAITAANTDSAVGGCPAGDGADTVVLREGDPYLLTEIDNETEGGNGLPAITSEIKLLGTTGAAIRRDENAPGFRILYVAEEGNLTVVETAILGGSNSNSSPAGSGIYNAGTLALESDTALRGNAGTIGAGLYNRGEATVRKSLITENVGSALGAGFYNEGTLTMISSEVSSNSDGDATGFYNKGTLTIEASSIENNANINASGAFINTPEGVIKMTRVDIIGNSDDGGTVYNSGEMTLTEVLYDGNADGIGNLEGGTLTLVNSTVSNVGRIGLTNEGTLNMQNSTVSGNERGGIENSGTLNVAYSTLNNNGFAARDGVGILNSTSEGDAGTVTLVGTIVAGHDTDCEGEINSEGYNLDGDGSCNLSGQGDLSSVDPQLGDLQENGVTLTHPLQEGSPAVDAIPTDACEVDTDQRGASRPQGEACDIGAFEVEQ